MGSGRSIDHVVVAVRDLDRAAHSYEALGFTLTPRAMHDELPGLRSPATLPHACGFTALACPMLLCALDSVDGSANLQQTQCPSPFAKHRLLSLSLSGFRRSCAGKH